MEKNSGTSVHPKEFFPLIPCVNVNMTVPSTPRYYECLNSAVFRWFSAILTMIFCFSLFPPFVFYMHKEESVTSTHVDPYCRVDCQFNRVYIRLNSVCRDTFGAGIA